MGTPHPWLLAFTSFLRGWRGGGWTLWVAGWMVCHPFPTFADGAGTKQNSLATPQPWSFTPLQSPAVPTVRESRWPKTELDAFLLARMEAQGRHPAPPASRRHWLRRVTFDLTGLPPTPEALDAFENDSSSDAYTRVIDRLLADPHYGEQWGRHWLDVIRYADTAGDTADYPVDFAWRYRNYVIDAFNTDKPYDVFVREQLAGDILANQNPSSPHYAEQVTATGFIAVSRRFGFDSENYHHLTIQDTLDVMGQSFLGLSLGCARCHDHKFDPITMRDYYALYGIFDSTRYSFPGSEQKPKLRAMVPLRPPDVSQVDSRAFEDRVATLTDEIESAGGSAPSAVVRSLHDPDGDFEVQKDAAGGSYGVIVPPWLWKGKMRVTLAAQSPYKNVYRFGRFGVEITGGTEDYTLSQKLPAKRFPESTHRIYLNVDFRIHGDPSHAPSESGLHRFWVGNTNGLPLFELFLSEQGAWQRKGDDFERIALLQTNTWYNLQGAIDMGRGVFEGILNQATTRLSLPPIALRSTDIPDVGWVGWDSSVRGTRSLPRMELDHFCLQTKAFAAPTELLSQSESKEHPPRKIDALNSELTKRIGIDGGFEFQELNAPLQKPWNLGPNAHPQLTSLAQSPFTNCFPSGHIGLRFPSSSAYDGAGVTLTPTSARTESKPVHVGLDFRVNASQDTLPEGQWRFYVGHGAGSSRALELHWNARRLEIRHGDQYATEATVTPQNWQQISLDLDLQSRTFRGTITGPNGNQMLQGTLDPAWDGTLDYAFVDSYGHQTGLRPELDIDNLVIQSPSNEPADLAGPTTSLNLQATAQNVERVRELRHEIASLKERAGVLASELTQLLMRGPCDSAYGAVEGTPHNVRMQMRGEPEKPGDEIPRGFIQSLGGKTLPKETQGSGRLELAQWLTTDNRPLLARVMVNRIWLYHFGKTLVGTPNDFGRRGAAPTDPELLDFLASRFIANGWSIKSMHRWILSSAAYQLDSGIGEQEWTSTQVHGTAIAAATSSSALSSKPHPPGLGAPRTIEAPASLKGTSVEDYSHFDRRRLSAEEIRDAILFVSGDLTSNKGEGHAFPDFVHHSYTQHGPFSADYDHSLRSIYLMTQRLKRHPFLALFDGPDPNASSASRRVTTVPTQALYFLNSPFVHERAEHFAQRLTAATPQDEDQQIRKAWTLTLGRLPSSSELEDARTFLMDYRKESADGSRTAMSALVRCLFGNNEFVVVD